MIRKYFEGNLTSSDSIVRTVTLWSENYVGINTNIVSGSFFSWVVNNDWSDYLEVGQDVKLFKADNSFVYAEVTSFNYNSSINQTSIGLDFTFDADYVRIESAESPIIYDNISVGVTSGDEYFLLDGDQTANFVIGSNVVAIDTLGNETVKEVLNVTIFAGDTRVFCVGANQTKYIGGSLKNTDKNGYWPIFDPIINHLETTWDNQGDEILEPIKASYTTVKYSNKDAWFDRFLEQYMDSDDDNLKLTIHRADKLEWAGNIVIDLVQWENSPKPRQYTFKATDGIDRLKGITYERVASQLPNFNVAASKFKITDHIFACLSANGLSQFWESSDVYLFESCEYYNTLVSIPFDTKSVIDYSLLTNSIFFDRESSDPVQYRTCYEVLREICKLFSLRMFISDGAYYLQQVRNFKGADIKSRAFLKNKTYTVVDYDYLVTATTSGTIGDFRVLGGGMYGYFAGLAEATLDYYQSWPLKINTPTQQGIAGNATLVFELGDFTGGAGSGKSVNVFFRVNAPAGGIVYVRIWLEDSVGNITHHIVSSGNDTPIWRVAPTVTNRGGHAIPIPQNNITQTRRFETLELPASGKLRMNVQTTGGGFGNPVVNWLEVFVPTSHGLPETRQVRIPETPNNKYSKILQLEPLIVTEGDSATTTNTVVIWSNYPNLPAIYKNADDEWSFPQGATVLEGTLSINKVREAYTLQFRPVEKYMGGFVGAYWPHQAIGYDGKTFVFNGFTKDYAMDEISGEWFEVFNTTSDVDDDVTDPRDIPHDPRDGRQGEFAVPFSGVKNIVDGLGKIQETVQVQTGVFNGTTFQYDVNKFASNNPDVENIQAGDFMVIMDNVTMQPIGEFEVNEVADIGGGAYEIRFDSQAFDAPIPAGALLCYKEDKTIVSNKVRADVVQTSSNKTVEELKDIPSGGIGVRNGEFYFKDGADLYKVTGTLVL
jgi:hypothetical protein